MTERAGHPQSGVSWSARPAATILSAGVVLAASLVVAAYDWRGWHTGLLAWGLALAAAGVLYAIGSEKLALRLVPDASDADRARLRSRQRINEINILIIGVGIAVLASGTGWVAVDAGFTALFVVAGIISTVAGIQVARRRQSSEQQPE